MARVLAISSQTVFGAVGNSAAVPTMQHDGHDVLAVPTVLLSYHPGLGKPAGQATPAQLIGEILQKLQSIGALASCDAVMTGYFAAVEQVDVVAAMVCDLKQQRPRLQVLVDPIIGDNGALYVAPDVAAAIRDRLLPFATIVTPNAFELSWLAGDAVEDEKSAVAAARKLAIPETLVTSVPDGSSIATCLVTSGETATHRAKRLTDVPHGTGDFLAGAYLSRRLTVPASQAFPQAMARLQSAIAKSAGSSSLVLS